VITSTNPAQNYMYNQGTSGTNFQGKEGKSFKVERQEELGLNVDMTKFRMYDYALGRFTSIDPLAVANPQESWTPYQYAYNSPIQYNDPYGDCPWCFGALVGALVDVAVQAIEISLDDTKSAKDFSWSSVGVSAAAGATGVGLVSKLKKVGTLGKLAVEASLDAAASAGTQFAKDGEVDLGDVAIDVIGGQTAGKVAGDFAESKFLKSNKGKKLQEGINQQKNAKRGKSNTISKSKADVKGAENKLTRVAAARGVGASTAASGAASTGVTEATKKIEDDKKE
jgi:RHS repeat-associated protein